MDSLIETLISFIVKSVSDVGRWLFLVKHTKNNTLSKFTSDLLRMWWDIFLLCKAISKV